LRRSIVADRLPWIWSVERLALTGCLLATAFSLPTCAQQLPGQRSLDDSSQSQSALVVAAAMEQVVEEAIARAGASVVAISRERIDAPSRSVANDEEMFFPMVRRFRRAWGGANEVPWMSIPSHFAAGVIISRDGSILTTYDAIDDPQKHRYTVWYRGEELQIQRLPATVQASDPWTDLAVLKVDAEGLTAMPMGDADRLRVGSFVVTLGNPYAIARDGFPSASWGIVSNLQRVGRPVDPQSRGPISEPESLQEFQTLIQVDTRLNLGTSGGALINLRGELVGITTALAASSGYEQSAGYAIPIDDAMRAAVATMEGGRLPSFGFLGIMPADDLSPMHQAAGLRGAVVRSVVPGLPADKAGLGSGDLILSVNGRPVDSGFSLVGQLSRLPAGSPVTMTVLQEGRRSTSQVTAQLGKKLVSTSRPGYARLPPRSWRGMQVDTSTAQSAERFFSRRAENPPTDVMVVRVDLDSPGERAGMRMRYYIDTVDGVAARDPDHFYELVEGKQGPVELGIYIDGRWQKVVIEP
jgi:serine protease Do